MFLIPFFLKPSVVFSEPTKSLGVLVSDNLSISSDAINVKSVSTITYSENFDFLLDVITNIQSFFVIIESDNFNILSEDFYYKIPIIETLQFSDYQYLNLNTIVIDYLFKLSYSQITSITLEDFLSARFLPDYHTIEYLAKDAQVDRYSVSKILVSLSNLLRECKNYDVRQINAISLRIHKATMNNNKTVFVITEY